MIDIISPQRVHEGGRQVHRVVLLPVLAAHEVNAEVTGEEGVNVAGVVPLLHQLVPVGGDSQVVFVDVEGDVQRQHPFITFVAQILGNASLHGKGADDAAGIVGGLGIILRKKTALSLRREVNLKLVAVPVLVHLFGDLLQEIRIRVKCVQPESLHPVGSRFVRLGGALGLPQILTEDHPVVQRQFVVRPCWILAVQPQGALIPRVDVKALLIDRGEPRGDVAAHVEFKLAGFFQVIVLVQAWQIKFPIPRVVERPIAVFTIISVTAGSVVRYLCDEAVIIQFFIGWVCLHQPKDPLFSSRVLVVHNVPIKSIVHNDVFCVLVLQCCAYQQGFLRSCGVADAGDDEGDDPRLRSGSLRILMKEKLTMRAAIAVRVFSERELVALGSFLHRSFVATLLHLITCGHLPNQDIRRRGLVNIERGMKVHRQRPSLFLVNKVHCIDTTAISRVADLLLL